MEVQSIKKFFHEILNVDSICLTGHQAPDGDCIASMLIIHEYLRLQGKAANVVMHLQGVVPYNYDSYVKDSFFCKQIPDEIFDLFIILDCANQKRVGAPMSIVNKAKKTIAIDHHITNTYFADVNIVNAAASSTGEVLYDMLCQAGQSINSKMAEYIYICILTDTEKFMKRNTSAKTHRITAALMDKGIDFYQINKNIYHSKPSGMILACAASLAGLRLLFRGKLGIVKVTRNEARLNYGRIDEIDGIIDQLCEIKNVEIECVLKEYGIKLTRVSLRTTNGWDILSLAQKYNGGGHKDSAGFILKKPVLASESVIIHEIAKILISSDTN